MTISQPSAVMASTPRDKLTSGLRDSRLVLRQVVAYTHTDESTSTPGGELVSTPHILGQNIHLASDRCPVVLHMHKPDDKSNEPDACWMCAKMATKAVQNIIQIDGNMVAEFVPKVIENDHRWYLIVYGMTFQETVKISTLRWSPISFSDR